MDEAPMLYIGSGTLNGPGADIAVDPLEGTKFTANEPNAFSVLAVSERDVYYQLLIHIWKK